MPDELDPLSIFYEVRNRVSRRIAISGNKLKKDQIYDETMTEVEDVVHDPSLFNLILTRTLLPSDLYKEASAAPTEIIGDPADQTKEYQQRTTILVAVDEDFKRLIAFSDSYALPPDPDDFDAIKVVMDSATASLNRKLLNYFQKHEDVRVFGAIKE